MNEIEAAGVSRAVAQCLHELSMERDPLRLLRSAWEHLREELDSPWALLRGNGTGPLGALRMAFNARAALAPQALPSAPDDAPAERFFVGHDDTSSTLDLWLPGHIRIHMAFGAAQATLPQRQALVSEVGRYLRIRLEEALELQRSRLAAEAMERRISDLSLLFKGIDVTLRSVELSKVLRAFMACVTSGEAIGFNRAFLLLLDEEQRELRGVVAVGPATGEEAQAIWTSLERVSLEDVLRRAMEESDEPAPGSLTARVRRFALPLEPERSVLVRALLSTDFYNIHIYRAEQPEPFAQAFGSAEFVVIPILGRERALGVIVADNLYSGAPIVEERVSLLSGMANHVGVVIENALMFEDISRRYAELNEVQEINRALLSTTDYTEVLRRIAQISATTLNASGALLFIATPAAAAPRLEMRYHASGLELSEAALGRCAELAREILGRKRGARETRVDGSGDAPAAELICAPMSVENEIVGVLMVYRAGEEGGRGAFDGHSRRFLSIIADQAAMAMLSGQRLRTIRDDQRRIELLNELLYRNEKLAALGQASSKIAHEIRNPLTALGGFARRMLRSTSLRQEERQAVEVIAHETARLERILNDQLAFVRSARLQREPTSLNDVVHESVMLLGQQLQAGRAGLELALDPGLPRVSLDADRMKQVLVNLLMNAIAAVPAGGLIRIATRAETGRVVLEVANSGEPIPAQIRDSLFLPFMTTRQEGTGLGLAVVHQIVMEHDGRIEAVSQDPWGTIFRIFLPDGAPSGA